ncbi:MULTISPECIES: sporulation YhaL family protein [Neobacillus]|uniref:Sporulation YhaL family protein n=1 Tax=Neobacillus sedimentimangrovi TaxID=2699460 RepID=A0ABS8QG89_9BACI|nr:sporulation YhaL family protein [Neobacillus sedimentimangrovi]AIM17359.1 SigE-dependent sporulation protein [Bacillus sp. X1(2014)]MCD4837826.1 sporulation YhaL family protein [Neobacillus sedimentimangrovi]
MTIPFWIYAVVAGIIVSAWMAIKTGREERKLEMEEIEREGEIYMKRMEKEKKMREGINATGE